MNEPNGYAARLARLEADLASLPSIAVALSGGVDSSVLVHAAGAALGRHALAVTALSPSVPSEEVEIAREVTRLAGVEHLLVETHEMEDPRYVRNDARRCYFCKAELFGVMERIARERGIAAIGYGAITDDLGDFRPGAEAAREFRVLGPLVEAGFTKQDVRRYAREAGLPNAERPASACLSSRIPYGTAVTPEALASVGSLEAAVKRLGYEVVRVRHHDDVARIELDPSKIERAALVDREAILAAARAAGYARAALDLRGYRRGAMNEVLATAGAASAGAAMPAGVASETRGPLVLLRADEGALGALLRAREPLGGAGAFVALDLDLRRGGRP